MKPHKINSVKALRAHTGLTQEKFSKIVKMSRSQIAKLEAGEETVNGVVIGQMKEDLCAHYRDIMKKIAYTA